MIAFCVVPDGTRDEGEHGGKGVEMRTLEVIRLRLAGDNPDPLPQLIHRAGAEATHPLDLTVFRQAGLTTDLAIHLVWRRPEEQGRKSPAGLALASVLREYGVVDHSVWVEEKGQEASRGDRCREPV